MSILPITKDTIVLGTNDMGITIHSKDNNLSQKMKLASVKLNLKPHYSGLQEGSMVYSASDVEGHIGTDGKYYLLDFSRVWPPETPKPGIQV